MTEIPLPDRIIQIDGTLCFEWYGENNRAALFFEKDPMESSWHFVSKMSVGGEMYCEKLSKININKFIECICKTKENKNGK